VLNSTYNFRSINKGSTRPFVFTSKTWKTAVFVIVAMGRLRDATMPRDGLTNGLGKHQHQHQPLCQTVTTTPRLSAVRVLPFFVWENNLFGCCNFSMKGKYETKI